MCGHFILWSDESQLSAHYGLADVPTFNNGYNIAPSADIPVVRNHLSRQLVNCHWGLIPPLGYGTRLKPINARPRASLKNLTSGNRSNSTANHHNKPHYTTICHANLSGNTIVN